jgi:hypothetical protein
VIELLLWETRHWRARAAVVDYPPVDHGHRMHAPVPLTDDKVDVATMVPRLFRNILGEVGAISMIARVVVNPLRTIIDKRSAQPRLRAGALLGPHVDWFIERRATSKSHHH